MSRRIVILCGGPDEEREISIESGRYVHSLLKGTLLTLPKNDIIPYLISNIKSEDYIVNLVHGKFGEGGPLKHILKYMNCKVMKSDDEICIDKYRASMIVSKILNIPTIDRYYVTSNEEYKKLNIEFPRMISHYNQGSSYDMHLLDKDKNIPSYRNEWVVSEYIHNAIDISVTIVNEKILNIIYVQYDSNEQYFSWKAKHNKFECHLFKKEVELITNYSLSIARYFNALQLSRIDFLYTEKGIKFLEINTIPGMTERSILFQAADLEKLDRKHLLEKLIYENL